MENNNVNFFSRIGRSISDFDFYRIIVRESIGKAIGYLVVFSLIIGILSIIKPIYQTNKGIQFIINYFESDIPYFELKNGELQVDGEMPIVIEEGSNIFIIDTTGQSDENILNEYNQGFLLTKAKMITKQGIEKTEYAFSEFGELQFNKEDIQGFLPSFKIILIPLIIFGIVLGTMLGKLFSSLFISLIGLLVNAVSNGNFKYGDIYKIGIYSMTLPSIIKFIIKQVSFQIPFFGFLFFFIYYGIVVFYIVKAIAQIKKEKQEIQEQIIQ